MILVSGALYFKNKKDAFNNYILCFVLGNVIGFIFYTIVPAIGPWAVNAKDFVISGSLVELTERIFKEKQFLFQHIPRDVFPSMHTANTVLFMIFTFKFEKKIFWITLIVTVGLIISCVYLKYHYVIDIFAGIFLAFFVYYLGCFINRFWEKKVGKIQS